MLAARLRAHDGEQALLAARDIASIEPTGRQAKRCLAAAALGSVMIRFVLRFIGLLLLALAFIFVIYDGMKSIADGGILLTKTSEVWNVIHDAACRRSRR